MMKRITIIFISIALILAVILLIANWSTIQRMLPQQTAVTESSGIVKNEPTVACKQGDERCQVKNEKIMVNTLTGESVSFARHQCDGPRACPTPKPEETEKVIEAIRSFAKEKTLELLPLTGINAVGKIYYCSHDNRCWSYDIKTKKVGPIMTENKLSPITSPKDY